METLILIPENKKQSKAILDLSRQLKIKVEHYKEPDKQKVLKSIERGIKQTKMFIDGKLKLNKASILLNEL